MPLRTLTAPCCLLLALSATACGYLDDDLDLSDEEFADSFHAAGESDLQAGSLGLYGSGRGCGVGYASHTHHGHGSHGPVMRKGTGSNGDTPSPARADKAHRERREVRWVVLDEDDQRENRDDLKTWGDYLELEWRRTSR